jgi:hypothetical protein
LALLKGVSVSTDRIRLSGHLGLGNRGLVLNTKDEALWIVESEELVDQLLGTEVIVEGTVVGLDRVKADWIGAR